MTIEEAETIVHRLDLAALCIPSTSHTEDDHRFRLIFPLAKTISKADVYKATYAKLAEYFNVDPACKDVARFFFGGKLVDGFWFDAKLLEPVAAQKPKKAAVRHLEARETVIVGDDLKERVEALYGEERTKVPESIADFLTNAPDNLAGRWYHASNRFLFTCGLCGLDREKITEIFFSLYPHEELTEYKVDKMIEDGYNARDDEAISRNEEESV